MLLSTLLNDFSYTVAQGDTNVEIDDITYDSRANTKDTVFVMLSGEEAFFSEAIKKGAKAVVLQKCGCINYSKYKDITIILVENARQALAHMSRVYFDYPDEKLFTIGITGTKGKTTTAYMIHTILVTNGIKAGLIGTIETIYNEEWYPQVNTTPESYVIYEIFSKMHLAGCKVVVMEVSSQGLKMMRCEGINFDIGVFTNISPDHISKMEHANFEEYLECKKKLFSQCKLAVVNSDDKEALNIIRDAKCPVSTYGINTISDNMAYDINLCYSDGREGVNFRVKGENDMNVTLSTPGIFNVYNSLCAISVTKGFRTNEELTRKALKNVMVKGRIETIPSKHPFTIIIDYAHNALSLNNLLNTLRDYKPVRLICCFGCGGNRDKKRRFEMGKVSGRMADITIVTSDNPRFENPGDIINDIVTGIKEVAGVYMVVEDRKEAIEYAIKIGKPGDIIVFAGKGHEDYQEINGERIPFNERLIINKLI